MKRVVLWALQSKCNLNCRYCYFTFGSRKLEKDPIHRLVSSGKLQETIAKIAQYGDIVYLTGGEPTTLDSLLVDIVKQLSGLGKKVILTTNGVLTKRKLFDELAKVGINGFLFSLDSFSQNQHNKYRSFWKETVDSIAYVSNLSPDLINGICMVVNKENLSQIKKTLVFAKSIGTNYFRLQLIYLPKGHPLREKLLLSKSELMLLRSQTDELFEFANSINLKAPCKRKFIEMMDYLLKTPRYVDRCPVAEHLAFVTEDFSVVPCAAGAYLSNSEFKVKLGESVRKPERCPKFSEDCACLWNLVYSEL
ncbi:MAG TPA: radical SAM protein [bacterium]|nr:radical SAM protein [bacterium]